jgi:hypothetical protein
VTRARPNATMAVHCHRKPGTVPTDVLLDEMRLACQQLGGPERWLYQGVVYAASCAGMEHRVLQPSPRLKQCSDGRFPSDRGTCTCCFGVQGISQISVSWCGIHKHLSADHWKGS